MVIGVRTNLLREENESRDKVSFIELFFDLVFAFAITQVAHFISQKVESGHALDGFIDGAIILLAVWWVWVCTTWAVNMLNPEKAPVRWMLIALMFLGLIMSTSIGGAFDGGTQGDRALLFAGAYVALQIGRAIFVILAMAKHSHDGLLNMVRVCTWFTAAAAPWIVGSLVDENRVRVLLWLLALAIDYIGPTVGFWLPKLGATPVRETEVASGHMSERAALFIIIALGESLLVTGSAFANTPITATSFAAFTAAFVGSILVWLVYFNHGEESGSRYIRRSASAGGVARFGYTYMHAVVVLGVVVVAVADSLVLAHPTGPTNPVVATVVYGAPGIYLLGNLFFKRATGAHWLASHMIGIVMLAVFGVLAATVLAGVSPLGHTWISNAILAIVLILEDRGFRRGQSAPTKSTNVIPG